jgi:hypothetical protein
MLFIRTRRNSTSYRYFGTGNRHFFRKGGSYGKRIPFVYQFHHILKSTINFRHKKPMFSLQELSVVLVMLFIRTRRNATSGRYFETGNRHVFRKGGSYGKRIPFVYQFHHILKSTMNFRHKKTDSSIEK